jgi:ATP-binding cassette subfamily B protein
MIQRALAKVIHHRTSLIIAHRLSTIRSCHRILVMEKGTIVEDGSHEKLLRQRGRYWTLYTQQYRLEQENHLLGTQSEGLLFRESDRGDTP